MKDTTGMFILGMTIGSAITAITTTVLHKKEIQKLKDKQDEEIESVIKTFKENTIPKEYVDETTRYSYAIDESRKKFETGEIDNEVKDDDKITDNIIIEDPLMYKSEKEQVDYSAYSKKDNYVRKEETIAQKIEEELESKGVKLRSGRPYIIDPDEYFDGLDGYDSENLTYYSDNVLVDDDDQPVEDPDSLVGLDNLKEFSNDIETLFVRNPNLKKDFEIDLCLASYSEISKHDYMEDD